MKLAAAGKLAFDRLVTDRIVPERAPEIYAGLKRQPDDYFGVMFDWAA